MVKHRTGSYEIEAARLHRPDHNILLPKLQIRHMHLDERKIEITAMARPSGATCLASHAEIDPLPQPTSSVLAPDLMTSSD
ncbi:MAG: hypothetical protein AUI00_00275 [Verrucomicrobia bacterium 13_2_20CM_2_54_15]|nr:MAG: hypothetical protein AUI00_00275 [Verrucomicrobia bacterium 13_2_20CM_2_54_15]